MKTPQELMRSYLEILSEAPKEPQIKQMPKTGNAEVDKLLSSPKAWRWYQDGWPLQDIVKMLNDASPKVGSTAPVSQTSLPNQAATQPGVRQQKIPTGVNATSRQPQTAGQSQPADSQPQQPGRRAQRQQPAQPQQPAQAQPQQPQQPQQPGQQQYRWSGDFDPSKPPPAPKPKQYYDNADVTDVTPKQPGVKPAPVQPTTPMVKPNIPVSAPPPMLPPMGGFKLR